MEQTSEWVVDFECGPVTVTVLVDADNEYGAVDEAEVQLEIWGVKLPREFDMSVTAVR